MMPMPEMYILCHAYVYTSSETRAVQNQKPKNQKQRQFMPDLRYARSDHCPAPRKQNPLQHKTKPIPMITIPAAALFGPV
jgi:hypothetical protein